MITICFAWTSVMTDIRKTLSCGQPVKQPIGPVGQSKALSLRHSGTLQGVCGNGEGCTLAAVALHTVHISGPNSINPGVPCILAHGASFS